MARFTLFNYDKPGKGISKNAPKKVGVSLYFNIFIRRFWKLLTLNLLYIISSLPAILIAWFISFYYVTWTASLASIDLDTNATALLIYIILMAVLLLLICGTGPATAAVTYVVRKYADDTHAWAAGEFYDHLKINFKQGLIAYFINILIAVCMLIAYNFYSYSFSGVASVFFRIVLIVAILLFTFMQFYVYHLMAGYKIKLRHIYKSALLLSLAHFGWNIAVLCACGIFVIAGLYLLIGLSLAGYIYLGLLLFCTVIYTQVFMTNKIIKHAVGDPRYFSQNRTSYEKDDMFE